MINNFFILKPLIESLQLPQGYFHLQIICRNKDSKNLDNYDIPHEQIIKTYLIKDITHLDNIMGDIVVLCESFRARAYINLSCKWLKDLQNNALYKLALNNYTGNIVNLNGLFNSCAAEVTSDEPIWVIDIDDNCNIDIEIIKDKLYELYSEYQKNPIKDLKPYIYGEIPTPNGNHLLVRPFNLQKFGELFPNIQVHKNSAGTLLYFPVSLDKPEISFKYK